MSAILIDEDTVMSMLTAAVRIRAGLVAEGRRWRRGQNAERFGGWPWPEQARGVHSKAPLTQRLDLSRFRKAAGE